MNQQLDECLYRAIDKNLTDSFGCSLPYVPDYGRGSPVCGQQDENTVQEAVSRYYTLRDREQRQLCSRPCSVIEVFSGR